MAIKKKVPCPRCDGKGVIPQYFYNRKGICFLCWGSKYIYIKVPNGTTEEAYLEKLRKDEMEHLKNHPPKVPMPDADKHRNKEYFKGANTKIDVKPADKEGDPADKGNKGGKDNNRTDLKNDRNTIIVERVEGDMVIQRGKEYTAFVSKGVYRNGKVVGISHAKKTVTFELNRNDGSTYKMEFDVGNVYPKGYDGVYNKKNYNGDTVRKDGGTPSKVEKVTFDENSEDFKNLLTRNLEQLNRTKKNIEENLKNTELKIEKWNRDKKDGMAGSGTDKVLADLEFEKNRLLQRQANVDEAIRRVELAELRKKLETKSVGVLRHEISTAQAYIERGRPKFRPADYTEEMNKKGLAKAKDTITIANEIIKQIEAERPKVDRNTIIREPLELSKLGQEYTVLKRGERVKIYHSGPPEKAIYHEGVITAVSNATGKIKVKRDGIDEDSAWHDSWIDVRSVKEKLEPTDEKPVDKPSTTDTDKKDTQSFEEIAKLLKTLEEMLVKVDDDENKTTTHFEFIRKQVDAINIPDDDSDEAYRLKRQKRRLLRDIARAKEGLMVSERLKDVKEAKDISALQKAIKEFDRDGFTVYADEDLDRFLSYNVDKRIKSFMESDMEEANVKHAVLGFKSSATSEDLKTFYKKMKDKYGNVPEAKKSLDDLLEKVTRAIDRKAYEESVAERERKEKERFEKAEEERRRIAEAKNSLLNNIQFKDTELGRKVKELVGKSEISVERTAKIGKVVAEALESRIAELYGEGYAEVNEKFEAIGDKHKKVGFYKHLYNEAMNKSYDRRLSPEKRQEWTHKKEMYFDMYNIAKGELSVMKRDMTTYHEKLNKVKEQAYLSVMQEIREMGGEWKLPASANSKQGAFITDKYKNDISKLFPKEWLELAFLSGYRTSHFAGRSYVQGRNICVDGREGEYLIQRPVFIHELQHAMDASNENLKKLTKDLYVSLTNKGKVDKIYHGTSEYYRTKNDGTPWLHKYMGKIYSINGKKAEDSLSWEINTMAMEAIIAGNHESHGIRLQDVEKEVYYHMLGVLASV